MAKTMLPLAPIDERFVKYCYISNSALIERKEDEQTEIRIEHAATPVDVYPYSTPDLILRCTTCGALVPYKYTEQHHEFHVYLEMRLY